MLLAIQLWQVEVPIDNPQRWSCTWVDPQAFLPEVESLSSFHDGEYEQLWQTANAFLVSQRKQ